MALLIPTDGTPAAHVKPNLTQFRLVELQAAVGGDIEIVTLGGGLNLIVLEDGKVSGAVNRLATQLAHSAITDGDWIAGPALLITDDELSD